MMMLKSNHGVKPMGMVQKMKQTIAPSVENSQTLMIGLRYSRMVY